MVRRIVALAGLSAAVFALYLIFGPPVPTVAHPPVPVDAAGVPQCTTCHGPAATAPEAATAPLPPADHAAYKPESCATCHAAISAPSPLSSSYSKCATCHSAGGTAASQTPAGDRVATLPDGEKLNIAIDIPRYLSSVHGDFSCTECHASQDTVPHAALTADGRREWTRQMATQCESCHQRPTASYEESFHGMAARLGVIRAASCPDCHTAHAVQAPPTWSLADRAAQCSTCHAGATESFASGWMGHQEASLGWFPAVFLAEKGFVALTALALGAGIVHVELDVLHWGWNKLRRKKEDLP